MTTLFEPPSFREWRVNRVCRMLTDVAANCADPKLPRRRAEELANQLRSAALVVADLYVCQVCAHPEIRTCTECPIGGDTASAAPDLPHSDHLSTPDIHGE